MQMEQSLPDVGDRKRININEPAELDAWARKFGVTTGQLKSAVGQVGTYAEAVERKLKSTLQTQS
jgi:Protein of unknown function (DUF3606)